MSPRGQQDTITRARLLAEAEKRALAILGLEQSASVVDIKRSYWLLAMENHPDKHPDDQEAEERFRMICAAYEFLMGKHNDPEMVGKPAKRFDTDPARSGRYNTDNDWGMFLWWRNQFFSPFAADSPKEEE